MKTTDIFAKLKKEYQQATPSKSFRKHGWEELQPLLDKKAMSHIWETPLLKWATISVFVLFISGTTVFAAATKAKPGETLYSVKQFSEGIGSLISPKPIILPEEIKEPTKHILLPTREENAASKSGENTKQKDTQEKSEEEKEIKKIIESTKTPEKKTEETKKEENKTEAKK